MVPKQWEQNILSNQENNFRAKKEKGKNNIRQISSEVTVSADAINFRVIASSYVWPGAPLSSLFEKAPLPTDVILRT